MRKFVRGWRWESERGATNPPTRLLLSLGFVMVFVFAADWNEALDVAIVGFMVLMLGAVFVGQTVVGADRADAEERRGTWTERKRGRRALR